MVGCRPGTLLDRFSNKIIANDGKRIYFARLWCFVTSFLVRITLRASLSDVVNRYLEFGCKCDVPFLSDLTQKSKHLIIN